MKGVAAFQGILFKGKYGNGKEGIGGVGYSDECGLNLKG